MEAARFRRKARPSLINCVRERGVSSSVVRRRGRRFVATTLALSFGGLAVPAAALADGAIDTSFNGSGYHFASPNGQDGISLDPVVDRVPTVRVATVVQSDGKIVIGGRSANDFMTLVRYNADGSLDTSFGTGGFVRREFPVTPGTAANPPALGPSGAVAMAQDASGNMFVAGNGGGRRSSSLSSPRRATTSRVLCATRRRTSLIRRARSRCGRTARS